MNEIKRRVKKMSKMNGQSTAVKQVVDYFLDRIGGSIPDVYDCIEWTGNRNEFGYGRTGLTRNGKTTCIPVHRLSYMAFVGPIPKGMFVCHHCDNPPCYNPKHLFVGTASDNREDAWRKGLILHGHKWFTGRDGGKVIVLPNGKLIPYKSRADRAALRPGAGK